MQDYWITQANMALMSPVDAPAVPVFFAIDGRYPASAPERRVWRQLPPLLAMGLFKKVASYCHWECGDLTEDQTWELVEALCELQRIDRGSQGRIDWMQIGKDLEQSVPGFRTRYLMLRHQTLDPREVTTIAS